MKDAKHARYFQGVGSVLLMIIASLCFCIWTYPNQTNSLRKTTTSAKYWSNYSFARHRQANSNVDFPTIWLDLLVFDEIIQSIVEVTMSVLLTAHRLQIGYANVLSVHDQVIFIFWQITEWKRQSRLDLPSIRLIQQTTKNAHIHTEIHWTRIYEAKKRNITGRQAIVSSNIYLIESEVHLLLIISPMWVIVAF